MCCASRHLDSPELACSISSWPRNSASTSLLRHATALAVSFTGRGNLPSATPWYQADLDRGMIWSTCRNRRRRSAELSCGVEFKSEFMSLPFELTVGSQYAVRVRRGKAVEASEYGVPSGDGGLTHSAETVVRHVLAIVILLPPIPPNSMLAFGQEPSSASGRRCARR
jgi:hypothetical protein